MTVTLTELAATDAGLPVASQEPSLTAGPSAVDWLVILTSRRDVMGRHVNRRHTMIAGGACVAVIIALNVLLLCQQFR
jgi:manganese transport protein